MLDGERLFPSNVTLKESNVACRSKQRSATLMGSATGTLLAGIKDKTTRSG
jgi:hypothetical protein